MRRNRKKKNGWQTLLSAVLVIAVISYIGYQGFRSVFSEYETELAVQHSVYESIDTTGLIYRSETVIPISSKGYPYFAVENGTRVANQSIIASVYGDANSGRVEQEINRIDQQIKALNDILKDTGSNGLLLGEQTEKAIYQLIQTTESGNLQEVGSAQFDLLSLLSKEQLTVGKTVDFSEKIAELKEQKKQLESLHKKPIDTIRATDAGYFVNTTDGFEVDSLKIDELKNMEVSDLQKKMSQAPKENDKACGKIVSGYQWYLMCVLPDSYYGELVTWREVSGKIFLRMPFVLDDVIPTTVMECNKDDKGQMTVLFRCDYMSAELSTIRMESVQIQMKEHQGLKVPKRAIVIDENQQAGVYVREGNVASFRKIKQIYSEPADYVVCEEVPNDSEYLQMYDDIITEGRGLYDGKIVE